MKVHDEERGAINKTLLDTELQPPQALDLIGMRKSNVRYVVLVLACLLMFGNNFSFDNPQALQAQLVEQLDISISQYNLLYSAFSFPNIFLTLIGGLIVDFLGVRFGITLFSALVVVAQAIVAFGGTFKVFAVMLCGRVLFGVASENLIIAQAALIGKWFRGKELSTAIGYIMTVPELASAANSFITPLIFDHYQHLAQPLFFSVILCIFSFLCAILIVIIDKRADREEEENQFIIDKQSEEEAIEKVSFADIKRLNGTFWMLVVICTLTLGCYIPFLDDANDFLQKKFEFTSVQAGKMLTLPYLFSAVFSPIVGPIIDRVGKRRMFILLTCGLFAVTQFLFGIMQNGESGSPNWFSAIPLIMLGGAYAMYSCVLIPSVQFVVDQRVMGTAFGLLGMFESVALAFFPMIAGFLVEGAGEENEAEGYSKVGFFFCGVSLIALLSTMSLYFIDKKSSMKLDFVNPIEPTDLEKLMIKTVRSESSSTTESDEDDEDETDVLKRRVTRSMHFGKEQAQQYIMRSQSMGR